MPRKTRAVSASSAVGDPGRPCPAGRARAPDSCEILLAVPIEHCGECGFDGAVWSDADALEMAERLPERWADAIAGIPAHQLQQRPIDDMWSIAEYTDHVREIAFGMRFVLDAVLSAPGSDLGDPPEPHFEPKPRVIDTPHALSGFVTEIALLCERLRSTPNDRWLDTVTIRGEKVDVHWIARHIVHDVTHHLGDVDRLRQAIESAFGGRDQGGS
jgi:hypothetical protein